MSLMSAGEKPSVLIESTIIGPDEGMRRRREAEAVLTTLEAIARERYVPPYALALVHAGLGQRDLTFEWLGRAYAARDVHLTWLPQDAKWDPFRDDPRFRDLLNRCGFGGLPLSHVQITGR